MVNIIVHFVLSGVPQTTLSALMTIYCIETKALVKDEQAMEEIGYGWYKYEYVPPIEEARTYVWTSDGSATITDDAIRFQHGTF